MLRTIFITPLLQKECPIILKYGHILPQPKLINEDILVISHCYRPGTSSCMSSEFRILCRDLELLLKHPGSLDSDGKQQVHFTAEDFSIQKSAQGLHFPSVSPHFLLLLLTAIIRSAEGRSLHFPSQISFKRVYSEWIS